jgi:hypothetical protein
MVVILRLRFGDCGVLMAADAMEAAGNRSEGDGFVVKVGE